MVRCPGRHLHRLRGARERDDRSPVHVPQADRSVHRSTADGAHVPDREHQQHACRRAGSLRVHGHDARGVLPGHGVQRGADGGLDFTLGRGDARDLESPGRDAGRGRLSSLPFRKAERILRKGGTGEDPQRPRRLRQRRRCRLPERRDFSEPVTQGTLRIVKVFWALDTALRARRHFPAINWLQSYSLYTQILEDWFRKNVNEEWPRLRSWTQRTLQEEAELEEIVRLVGADALPPD